jgi:hypothetical protein
VVDVRAVVGFLASYFGHNFRVCELRLITGRTRKPLSKKLNPIWWFQNDDEEQTAPWYKPEWPQWRRDFYWNFLRNPLQNFRCYVVGVQDRNYSVWGRKPVMTVQRSRMAASPCGNHLAREGRLARASANS